MKGISSEAMNILRVIIIAIVAAAVIFYFISIASAQAEKGCETFTEKVWYFIRQVFSAGPIKIWTPDAGC